VVQRSGSLRLVEEQLVRESARRGVLALVEGADLDGDLAVGEGIVAEVDDRHRTLTEEAPDFVLTDLLRRHARSMLPGVGARVYGLARCTSPACSIVSLASELWRV
jgi:hypothetical protein